MGPVLHQKWRSVQKDPMRTVKDIDLETLRRNHVRLYYFGLGFIQLKLDEVRRLHFYSARLPPITEDVHNHRYGFLSRVLAGRLTNRVYALGQGESHVLVNETCNPDIKAPARRDPVRLIPDDVR